VEDKIFRPLKKGNEGHRSVNWHRILGRKLLARKSNRVRQLTADPRYNSLTAEQQADAIRAAKRAEILGSWKYCTIDELIGIVTKQRFSCLGYYGSRHLIDRLYKIHGPELKKTHLARLEKFAQATNVPHEQVSTQKELQCFLAVLRDDPHRLKVFWKRYNCPNVDWPTWWAFSEAAGDLPTKDRDIIAQLIEAVETPNMFGPRYEAMLALGKIGRVCGKRAIDVIEKSIYDSSERVTAIRNRVVARIHQPETDWIQCQHCNHGYVDGTSSVIPLVESCAECLGLGYVPKSATSQDTIAGADKLRR
jgi:hypothetical protein